MARRKRMEFVQTSRGRRRSMPESFDRVFISRRMLMARSAIVGGFAVLAGKLGYMQIVDHDSFVSAARGNTQASRMLPAPRGLIYDRKGRLLAKNETAFQVEIIPELLPDRDTAAAERRRVLDQVIAELQLPDVLVIDWRQIPSEQRTEVYTRVQELRARTGEDLENAVKAIEKAAELNYLVLLGDPLDIDEAAEWRAAARTIPGLRVMNQVEYQLGNTVWDSKNPIVVKTDVPRETAMRIEANLLYLPGVRVDSSVLVRRYPGKAPMSHILGFVGPISQEEMEADENQSNGKSIYAQTDRIGKDGLEKALESTLRGQKGFRMILRDALGNEVGIAPGSEDFNREAVAGDSVALTIDLELQCAATRALKSYIEFSNEDRRAKKNDKNKRWSNSGAVVAMDPRNGDILAMASFPQFDNALLAQGISEAQWNELTDRQSGAPYFNRTIASAQPPGSTFKSFLAAAAIHEKTLQPEQTYVCTGGLGLPFADNLADYNEHPCWAFAEGHGPVNLDEALRTSCDVFFYNVGTKDVEGLTYIDLDYDSDGNVVQIGEDYKKFSGLGIDLLHQELTEQFWFSRPTGFLLGGEATGLIPSPEWLSETTGGRGWTAGNTIISSIGQGDVQVTPLQMAVNTVALANGGTIYTPNLIHETIRGATEMGATPEADADEAEHIPYERPQPLRQMSYTPEELEPVRAGMRSVVNYFEGQNSTLNGSVSSVELSDRTRSTDQAWPRTNPPGTPEEDRIIIAGKTGTAEVASDDPNIESFDDNNKYNNQHAWFTCWAPYDKPEIVVSVLLEFGGEGGTYAAPCADAVLRAYFETTGRRPRGQKVTIGDEEKVVSVLSDDGQPVIDVETAPTLAWFKPGETANTAGNVD